MFSRRWTLPRQRCVGWRDRCRGRTLDQSMTSIYSRRSDGVASVICTSGDDCSIIKGKEYSFSVVRSFVGSFIHSFIQLFIRSLVHLFIRSFICSFIYSIISLFTLPSIHPSLRPPFFLSLSIRLSLCLPFSVCMPISPCLCNYLSLSASNCFTGEA